MSDCIKCGSKKAYWMIHDKENKAEYYCDPCFKKYDLADYKKEMDDYHKKKRLEKSGLIDSEMRKPIVEYFNEASMFNGIDRNTKLKIISDYKDNPQDISNFISQYSIQDQIDRDNWSRIIGLIEILGKIGGKTTVSFLTSIIDVRTEEAIDYGSIQIAAANALKDTGDTSCLPSLRSLMTYIRPENNDNSIKAIVDYLELKQANKNRSNKSKDAKETTGSPKPEKTARHCPECDQQVEIAAITCPSCKKPLYSISKMRISMHAYLWAMIPSSIALLAVTFLENLLGVNWKGFEMLVFAIFFLSSQSSKKAKLLKQSDLGIYRPEI